MCVGARVWKRFLEAERFRGTRAGAGGGGRRESGRVVVVVAAVEEVVVGKGGWAGDGAG